MNEGVLISVDEISRMIRIISDSGDENNDLLDKLLDILEAMNE